MFFPVLLVLSVIWTATHGALSCETTNGLGCVFPFKRSAKGPDYNKCQPASKGKTWCATKVKEGGAYSAWGYCNLSTCKEVQTVEEATQQIESRGACYACIEHAAHGPPPHWQSLECLDPCVLLPDTTACFQCLVRTATRQCLKPCGLRKILDSYSLPADGSETCRQIRPVTATQSSTLNNDFLATNAIDRNAKTFQNTAGGEKFPWVAVQLTEDLSRVPVKSVIIINRVNGFGTRLKNLEVFVSDRAPDSSSVPFPTADKDAKSIGFFDGPGTDGQIIEFPSNYAMGSFVVIQMQGITEQLNIAEITTFSN